MSAHRDKGDRRIDEKRPQGSRKVLVADIVDSAQAALGSVDPTPYLMMYGANVWAGIKGYLDEVTAQAAEPVIAKYTGVLAAADVEAFTYSTTFTVLQSIRLDLGTGSQLHP